MKFLPAVLPLFSLGMLLVFFRRGILKKSMFLAAAAAGLLLFVLGLKTVVSDAGAPVTSLERASPGGGSRRIELEARTGDGNTSRVTFTVPERSYTDDEAQAILSAACELLDAHFPGSNISPAQTDHDLDLPVSIDPGITVLWRSDAPDILSSSGKIGADPSSSGSDVHLTAELRLGDAAASRTYLLRVFPKNSTAADPALRLADDAFRRNADNTQKLYLLPEEIGGQTVVWYKVPDNRILAASLLFSAILLLLPFLKKEREKTEKNRRMAELEAGYSEVVSKLQILLSAGLSIRQAFLRMAEDGPAGKQSMENPAEKKRRGSPAGKQRFYERSSSAGEAVREELSRTCYEMKTGITEADAYERLGERTGLPCYRTLSMLLVRSLRKGGGELSADLELEVMHAFEDRKRKARENGGKASVHLLIPLGIMLIIVLIIIMVPALMTQ